MVEGRDIGTTVSARDRGVLLRWSRSRTIPARGVVRSRIILMLAAGQSVAAVADALSIARATVRLWRGRFLEHGPRGLLQEARGRGRKPSLDLETRQALRVGAEGGERPDLERRARELGVSASTVSRWLRRRD